MAHWKRERKGRGKEHFSTVDACLDHKALGLGSRTAYKDAHYYSIMPHAFALAHSYTFHLFIPTLSTRSLGFGVTHDSFLVGFLFFLFPILSLLLLLRFLHSLWKSSALLLFHKGAMKHEQSERVPMFAVPMKMPLEKLRTFCFFCLFPSLSLSLSLSPSVCVWVALNSIFIKSFIVQIRHFHRHICIAISFAPPRSLLYAPTRSFTISRTLHIRAVSTVHFVYFLRKTEWTLILEQYWRSFSLSLSLTHFHLPICWLAGIV